MTAVGTAYGANQQKKAGKAAARGAADAAALSQEQFERVRQDQLPFIEAGQRGIAQLERLNAGDFSGFRESPDYQFALEQAIKGSDRSAAARGTQFSGGQRAALADRIAGMATQNYGQYYNRIAQLAGLGQNAAAGVGNAGMEYAGQAGGAIMGGAGIDALGRIGAGSTYANLGEQLSGAFGEWYRGQKQNKGQSIYGQTGSGMGVWRPQPYDPWGSGPAMPG